MDRALELKWDNRRAFAEDEDFDSLKGDPRLARRAGLPEGKLGRDDAWRQDLQFLVGELKRLHVDLYRKITPADLTRRIDQLRERVPALQEHEIIAEFFRLLAAVGDGHTLMFWPLEGAHAFHILPVRFYSFTEGFFVTEAEGENRALIGAKVIRFGDVPIAEAARRLAELIAHDNEYGIRRYIHTALSFPELLHTTRVIARLDEVVLEVDLRGGERRKITLKPLAPGNRLESVLPTALSESGSQPLWLSNRSVPYWFHFLPERRAVYVQYRECRNGQDETFAKFCDRVFEFIEKNQVEKLVLDLRNNEGGTNLINKYLVQGVLRTPKINRKGRLFVLVGRHTFSAAMCCAADLERWTEAVFVGEPTGSNPNFVGDTSRVILPYSGLRASVSTHLWQNSLAFDERTWIGPQVLCEPGFVDWISNRDPALSAALSYTRNPDH
jgi:hypothetical protein